jgi:hypothetical protein
MAAMNENRSFASLEPTLLARKGAAKPAMRPQVGPAPATASQPLPPIEDLGWNDMGEADADEAYEHEAEVLQLAAANGNGNGSLRGKPAVRRQIDAIAAHLARSDRDQARRPAKPEPERARRAAFTLRLDAQRHLKLRLACTIKNRSAQQIVTEALDRLLSAMPELDSLAAQLNKR